MRFTTILATLAAAASAAPASGSLEQTGAVLGMMRPSLICNGVNTMIKIEDIR